MICITDKSSKFKVYGVFGMLWPSVLVRYILWLILDAMLFPREKLLLIVINMQFPSATTCCMFITLGSLGMC